MGNPDSRIDEDAAGRKAVLAVVESLGPAAVALHLAAIVGWNARWASANSVDQVAEAARLLAEAAQRLERAPEWW